MKSVSFVKSTAWWHYQTVRNSGKRVISSLDRQLKVITTIIGSSEERLVIEQAQNDKEDQFFREAPHGSNPSASGRSVTISIT
jgi:hypothetical protein